MGGPTQKYCFGRVDDADGTKSNIFGINKDPQSSTPKCSVQGACASPLGATTVGLIYVNPEGPLKDPKDASSGQDPDPVKSALEIREVFGRMGMNDTETAALVAGGHAFGHCHGAKAKTLGLAGAHTSGFHGPWTSSPNAWTYEFLDGMLNTEWEITDNPTKTAKQWKTKDPSSKFASTMRLTSDLAFVKDSKYKAIVEGFMKDKSMFDAAFAHAWEKLIRSGVAWSQGKKCESKEPACTKCTSPQNNPDLDRGHWAGLSVLALIVSTSLFV